MRYNPKGEIQSIDWGATGQEAEIQNLEFVLGTHSDTIFLDRELGWEPPYSLNMNEAEVNVAGDIATLIATNFDNVTIEEIDFEVKESTLIPKMKVVFEENDS